MVGADFLAQARRLEMPAGLAPDFEARLREMVVLGWRVPMAFDCWDLAVEARTEGWTREELGIMREVLMEYGCWKGYW